MLTQFFVDILYLSLNHNVLKCALLFKLRSDDSSNLEDIKNTLVW